MCSFILGADKPYRFYMPHERLFQRAMNDWSGPLQSDPAVRSLLVVAVSGVVVPRPLLTTTSTIRKARYLGGRAGHEDPVSSWRYLE